jgi:hypothetical protein
MKTAKVLARLGLILVIPEIAFGLDVTILEYPDRFVVECDGSKDPKAAPDPQLPGGGKVPPPEQMKRVDEGTRARVRGRIEERMQRNQMRMEANEQALERQRKEQEQW